MRWALNLAQQAKFEGAPLPPLGPSLRKAHGGGYEIGAQITVSPTHSPRGFYCRVHLTLGLWHAQLLQVYVSDLRLQACAY